MARSPSSDAEDEREEVTAILVRLGIEVGDAPERAADALLPQVYPEMRRLAGSYLRRERVDHTLEPTALVHEAYMRLVDQSRVDWRGRSHFFAVGAHVMRRLLVDHARKKGSEKRGGAWRQVTLDAGQALGSIFGRPLEADEIVALDEALHALAEVDPRQSKIVELRFFAGFDVAEVAQHLGVSKRTVEGDWTHAKAWLRRELASGSTAE